MNEGAGTGRGAVQFAPGDSVVYPGHGVGKVISVESQCVGEQELKWFVISFVQDGMTLRVPLQKVKSSGLRRISTPARMESALAKLKSPQILSRATWSRRALEYGVKINSGDPCLLAEVVRDLHRADGQPQLSYWQQLLYGQALSRLVQELAEVYNARTPEMLAQLELVLDAA